MWSWTPGVTEILWYNEYIYISSKVGEAVEMAIASMIQAAVEIKEKEGKVI